ncbi:MAG: right-handed parallel beta-helix repeat-containing protein [Opitutaceae bacterium]|nr:right-handed parallel beta-helix repeat-containing protein [Opitutaceae bacterium]
MDDLDLGATIRGLSPGQKICNRYTLEKILGRGGMGVVWRARDESLEQHVAIKMLPEIVAADPSAVRDLKRETRRSQQLSHPHILRIYDFIESDRVCGITMELVEGGTLTARRLEQPQEAFDVDALSGWLRQIGEALTYAHEKAHIVHRDLKPANIMLTQDGEVKIADFGISASVTDSVSRVSQQAGSSGTPVYMSPQQMMGEPPAVTDDIYALGATLYELLTGKPPFYSGNIIMQVQGKVPPTIAARRAALGLGDLGEVPAVWEETIAACLAKEPKARPQSVREVVNRLTGGGAGDTRPVERPVQPAPAAAPPPVSPAPARVAPSRKIPVRTLTAVSLLLAGVLCLGIFLREQSRLRALTARIEAFDPMSASEEVRNVLGKDVQAFREDAWFASGNEMLALYEQKATDWFNTRQAEKTLRELVARAMAAVESGDAALAQQWLDTAKPYTATVSLPELAVVQRKLADLQATTRQRDLLVRAVEQAKAGQWREAGEAFATAMNFGDSDAITATLRELDAIVAKVASDAVGRGYRDRADPAIALITNLHRQAGVALPKELQFLATQLAAMPPVVRVPVHEPTLAAALKSAKPGSIILLTPGIYREAGLVVTQQVSIHGDGAPGAVTLRQDGDEPNVSLISINTGGVQLHNLTLEQTGKDARDRRHSLITIATYSNRQLPVMLTELRLRGAVGNAVWVTNGSTVSLDRVAIADSGWNGVGIDGAGTTASLKNVSVTGSGNSGVWLRQPAILRAGSCQFRGAGLHGITAEAGTTVEVENCIAADNKGQGFQVDGDDAKVRLIGNQATGNGTGFYLTASLHAELRNNLAKNNRSKGYYLSGKSLRVDFQDNTAESNQGVGFELRTSLGAVIDGAKILNNRSEGIQLNGHSDVRPTHTLRNSTVSGNGHYGVWVESSFFRESGNSVHGNLPGNYNIGFKAERR